MSCEIINFSEAIKNRDEEIFWRDYANLLNEVELFNELDLISDYVSKAFKFLETLTPIDAQCDLDNIELNANVKLAKVYSISERRNK